jgi:mandelate racemase
MISTTRLTVSGLRARAVDVPVQPPLETASATLGSAPLVLVDLLTEEGVTGRSYAFCYTPLALELKRSSLRPEVLCILRS